ncbi:hypothetical protein GO001_02305 [Streptomyces sp. NRRL B-1677]|uniref:DUF6777 domain-containing protein n=1 Tax=Streptomyces sp. NRRL B-1677 TaxID=2682966 RepID=UPI0018928E74|nr:DUF6777 domain-containing protein [Streptomyces sp. NRRL B-1677]MBF6044054.1 hypothetical protein [Streptomyces sp. NRRL B-1677]
MADPFREIQQKTSARRRRLRAVALLAAPALIGGAALAGCGSSGGKSVQLVLEAVGESGAFPFVEHPDTDLRGVSSATRGGGQRAGDARGAFGGVQGATRCDKASLIKQLTEDPEKARAWAAVKNIDEGRIGEYINGLTETILEFDTLVKNHDFRDGEASEYLSVLQKGVLVLVDNYTGPAVKCNCGNPLMEPDSNVDTKAASYTGTRWETFTATEVTVIKARTKEQGPVKQIPLVDPFQGDKAFDRGVGSDGSKDSKPFHWDPPKSPPGSPGSPGSVGTGSSGPSGGESSSNPPKDKSSEPSSGSSGSGSSGSSSSGSGSSGSGSSGPGSSSSGSGRPSDRSSAQGVRPSTAPPMSPRPGVSSQKPSHGSTTPGTPHTIPPRASTQAPKPTASRPVAPPVTEKPATEKPATQKPVTERPVTEKPVTEKPVKPVTPTGAKPVPPTEGHPVAPTAAKPKPPPPDTHAPPPPAEPPKATGGSY